MNRIRILALPAIVSLVAGVGLAEESQQFLVIVHPSSSISSISTEDLSKLFLKKKFKWPDGTGARPVDLPATSEIRKAFSKSVHGKGANTIEASWQRKIFTGRAVPPPKKASSADVVFYVRDHPGAVGYIHPSTTPEGCKVLTIE
jgi:ABC-type phosphate transport system substrate-binding protein